MPAKLRALAPLVRHINTSRVTPPPKLREPVYATPEYRAWRIEVVARAGGRCEAVEHGRRCSKAQPEHRMYADHIVELKDGGHPFDLRNGQCLCASHHETKTVEARRVRYAWSGSLTHPHLPKPTCRVMLICGPPAAGKSTYVRDHAAPADIIIDLDTIARQLGMGRHRPDSARPLLLERNRRLAALAHEPATRTAWVIVTAPSKRTRQWWCTALGVQPTDMVLLIPTRSELYRRVQNDPERYEIIGNQMLIIDRWFARELGVQEITQQYQELDGG